MLSRDIIRHLRHQRGKYTYIYFAELLETSNVFIRSNSIIFVPPDDVFEWYLDNKMYRIIAILESQYLCMFMKLFLTENLTPLVKTYGDLELKYTGNSIDNIPILESKSMSKSNFTVIPIDGIILTKKLCDIYDKLFIAFDEKYNCRKKYFGSSLEKLELVINDYVETDSIGIDNSPIIPLTQNDRKLGVLFCHGRKHKNPLMPKILKDVNIDWTYVDANLNHKPDIVGNFKSWEFIKELGLRKYDYVIPEKCPMGDWEKKILFTFCKHSRWLLKDGGSLYLSIFYFGKNMHIILKLIERIKILYGYSSFIIFDYIFDGKNKKTIVQLFAGTIRGRIR